MKRVKRRAAATLLIALFLTAGLGVFLSILVRDGGTWASSPVNAGLYSGHQLRSAILTDRDGLRLASREGAEQRYADEASVRISCLHVTGDFSGMIGTGALTAYADRLAGYSFLYGTVRGTASLSLSIDADLQTAAYSALAGRSGAVLVMNYETGEILCMVSAPSYDPNGEPDGSLDGVYLNRCFSATYTPGSVFKLVTLAAALDHMENLFDRAFYCAGESVVGSEKIVCSGQHGTQTIEQALANSCNCAFAELASQLGPAVLTSVAARLGFSGSLSLDGLASASGNFSPDSGDVAWSGIGQGRDLVSPYAMLRYVAAIAGGGTVREPTLLLGQDNGKSILLSEKTARALGDMMRNNVQYSYGQQNFPGLALHAKSGTAEVGGASPHAWFTGYLSGDLPLAFAVIVEYGGGGLAQAGALANEVLQKATEILG